jgi:hypothetical protein
MSVKRSQFLKLYPDIASTLNLEPVDTLILTKVLSYCESGLKCYESIAELAQYANVSERTARRSLLRLKSKGLIQVDGNIKYTSLDIIEMKKAGQNDRQTGQFVKGGCQIDRQTGQNDRQTMTNCPIQADKMTANYIYPLDIYNIRDKKPPFDGGGFCHQKEELEESEGTTLFNGTDFFENF